MAKTTTAKTASERFKRLLARGYFAPELPPCFVSDRLAERRKAIWDHVEGIKIPSKNGKGLTNKPAYKTYVSRTSWFNFPRFGRADRRHGVPNPIAYMAIAKVISMNFVDLRSRTRKLTRLSTSPLIFDWTGTRAILRPTIDLLEEFRLNLSSRREEYISADLRAFYHSIYTHSIPWAVRGKAVAKAKRNDDHYSNLLDRLSRNAQDGQTIGLPVGPDTSRILGEVVASGVDAELVSEAALGPDDASRYVDDYTVSSADGRSDAALVAAVRRAAGAYELELNQDKTVVVPTTTAPAAGWKEVALAHRPHRPNHDLPAFNRFFYELGRVRDERPDINVERWALLNTRIAFLDSDRTTWQSLIRHLINAYRRNSTLVSLLVELVIARHVAEPDDVDHHTLTDFLDHRIPVLALEDRTGELIWLLFMMIALRIKLKATTFERAVSLEEPMCAVLIQYAKHDGLILGAIDATLWNSHLNSDGLDGPMWLYAYEAARLGIVSGVDTQHVKDHSFFSALLKNKVVFLSIERGISSIRKAETGRRVDNSHSAKLRSAVQDFQLEDLDFDLESELGAEDEDEVEWGSDY